MLMLMLMLMLLLLTSPTQFTAFYDKPTCLLLKASMMVLVLTACSRRRSGSQAKYALLYEGLQACAFRCYHLQRTCYLDR